MNKTYIFIDIRCENKSDILKCIYDTINFMPGWTLSSGLKYGGTLTNARIYCFDLTNRIFAYWRSNNSYSDTMDEDEVIINNLEDISTLLEFVYLNADRLEVEDTVEETPSSHMSSVIASFTQWVDSMSTNMSFMGQYNIYETQAVFKTEMMKKMYETMKSGDVNFVTQNEYKAEYECDFDKPVEPTIKCAPAKSSNEFHKNYYYHHDPKKSLDECLSEKKTAYDVIGGKSLHYPVTQTFKLEKAVKEEYAKIWAKTKINPDFYAKVNIGDDY